jgi:hypothetical protein
VAVVLVGGWLLLAKSISNKADVAVSEPPKSQSEDKPAKKSPAKPSETASGSANESTSGESAESAEQSDTPSELTVTGPTENLIITAALIGGVVYLVALNRRLTTELSRHRGDLAV